MQLRLARRLEAGPRTGQGPMTVDEFLATFPEVPGDLAGESVLADYVRAFGPQLRLARKPTPCMGQGGDAPQAFYRHLVNDLAIYGIGLARRERTLERLAARVAAFRAQPATYACSLIPRQASGTQRAGCG